MVDCQIINMTEDGARLVAPQGMALPQIFQLQIDASRILGAAEVMWRDQNQVGVRFLTRI